MADETEVVVETPEVVEPVVEPVVEVKPLTTEEKVEKIISILAEHGIYVK
jgi:hypothetical protein